jgi:UDP-N-acetylglucosamine acyltransferase
MEQELTKSPEAVSSSSTPPTTTTTAMPPRPTPRKRPAWFSSLFTFRFFSEETPKISPQAVVDKNAEIAEDVEIGPFCVIGPDVKIGPGCRLLYNITILGDTTIGRDYVFFPNSVIGGAPQDKKYKGARTKLTIGNGNVFREAVTVHLGTEKGGGLTTIGDNNLLMVNAHIGHDAHLGGNCVLANNVMIAGHVVIGDHVAMMGGVAVHHFATIGEFAYIGAYSRVHHDVPPYCKVDGADLVRGLNTVGLRRAGFSEEDIKGVDFTYRKLFIGRKRPFAVAMAELEAMNGELSEHARYLVAFIRRRNLDRNGRYLESLRAKGAEAIAEAIGQALAKGPRPAQSTAPIAAHLRQTNGGPDGQVLLQDTTTCTGPYVTPGVDLLPGGDGNGNGEALAATKDVAAVINVTALQNGPAGESYNFALEESADNVTYTPAPGGLTLVTGAGVTAARATISKRFVRLALDAKGASPSITFKAWL